MGHILLRRAARHGAARDPLHRGHRARPGHPRARRGGGAGGGGTMLALGVAFMGAWLLFKAQLDILEAQVRAVTDILWTGSRRVRRWSTGDVRRVYYTVLAVIVAWGFVAMTLAQPIVLLQ